MVRPLPTMLWQSGLFEYWNVRGGLSSTLSITSADKLRKQLGSSEKLE